jgi:hypothetical protein
MHRLVLGYLRLLLVALFSGVALPIRSGPHKPSYSRTPPTNSGCNEADSQEALTERQRPVSAVLCLRS